MVKNGVIPAEYQGEGSVESGVLGGVVVWAGIVCLGILNFELSNDRHQGLDSSPGPRVKSGSSRWKVSRERLDVRSSRAVSHF